MVLTGLAAALRTSLGNCAQNLEIATLHGVVFQKFFYEAYIDLEGHERECVALTSESICCGGLTSTALQYWRRALSQCYCPCLKIDA
jgi:hypothetical protein